MFLNSEYEYIKSYSYRKFIEDGVVKTKSDRSKENDAHLFTKKVNGELYNKHSQKLIWSKNP